MCLLICSESCQHVHGCGFSRSVSSEETEYLPFFDKEGNVVHRPEITESLDQMSDFNHMFLSLLLRTFPLHRWWVEDMGKFVENVFGCSHVHEFTFIEKRHPITLSDLIKIRSRNENCDTPLLESA